MSGRALRIAMLLAAVAVCAWLAVRSRPAASEGRVVRQPLFAVDEIPVERVDRLELERPGAPTLVFERAAAGWSQSAPFAHPADAAAIRMVIDAFASLESTRAVDPASLDPDARVALGLDPERVERNREKIELVVIDYLQLLRSNSRRAQENRQIEIQEISYGIKALAKELKIPVIVLAQLNRNPEQRTGSSAGRPRLSDLRESGTIEQDADLVGLLVREKYYAEDEEAKKEAAGKATLIIAKQRNGPTGDVPLTFLEDFTRFEDRAEDRQEPN